MNEITFGKYKGMSVTGDLLDETGTNGEPLIKNVKILKKL